MDLAALVVEFADARRAMMHDPGRGERPASEYLVERAGVAKRYDAAAQALVDAADQLATPQS